MVTTICFVDDLNKALAESYRILKDDGCIILGFVDRESPVGKLYLTIKEQHVFYKDAVFYSTGALYRYLADSNFEVMETFQTIFGLPEEIRVVQKAEKGYGTGSFVVIKARKISDGNWRTPGSKHHPEAGLCADCEALRDSALRRIERCAFQPDKPSCGRCPVHCYRPEMRERIRGVMRFASPRMLISAPLAAARHLVRSHRKPNAKVRQAAQRQKESA